MPSTEIPRVNLLLLAGGQSSRMGRPKSLLPFPDGRPSYLHTLETLHRACPEAEGAYMTLREPSQLLQHNQLPSLPVEVHFIYNSQPENLGPGQGLMSAFEHDPASHWLVMPCDYPLMTASELKHLLAHHHPEDSPVTCFESGRAELEPLVAIWGSSGLAHAAQQNATTHADLQRVVREVGGTKIRPLYDHSLFNTNVQEDWDAAMGLLAGK
ncbi:MobA-like NTP transferase domain-containing protein [Apodospora peruviana]|uniref:MobA-like NTP transferase domain-containing protein n=1 Tax=Apodospora peruviana TaxID=516989 RepID=A0AAE0IIK4_9PEZI|nr:MobA-like NTP transferase domain-containing protein [Apodospora peruviana]